MKSKFPRRSLMYGRKWMHQCRIKRIEWRTSLEFPSFLLSTAFRFSGRRRSTFPNSSSPGRENLCTVSLF